MTLSELRRRLEGLLADPHTPDELGRTLVERIGMAAARRYWRLAKSGRPEFDADFVEGIESPSEPPAYRDYWRGAWARICERVLAGRGLSVPEGAAQPPRVDDWRELAEGYVLVLRELGESMTAPDGD